MKKVAAMIYVKIANKFRKHFKVVGSSLPRLSLAGQPDTGDEENVEK